MQLVLLWLTVTHAAAACDASDLAPSLADTEAAFRAGDAVAAHLANQRTRRALPCVREALDPTAAAQIHRSTALARYLQGDQSGVDRSMRAMLHADPQLELPIDLVPVDHPLRAAKVRAEEVVPQWSPKLRQEALIDGVRSGAVPVDQHYVVQRLRNDAVSDGFLVQRSNLFRSLGMGVRVRNRATGAPKALWWTGLGFGVAGVGLLGTAAGTGIAAPSGPDGDNLRSVSTATAIGGAAALLTSTVLVITSDGMRRRRDAAARLEPVADPAP